MLQMKLSNKLYLKTLRRNCKMGLTALFLTNVVSLWKLLPPSMAGLEWSQNMSVNIAYCYKSKSYRDTSNSFEECGLVGKIGCRWMAGLGDHRGLFQP